ncbi:MAG: HAD family phosphatase [Anaerolineae bacterium]|nr:HAD family phosphatase [Anaerolineae bacterium]
MIEAAIFDWGGVLMRTVDPLPRMAWERRLGLPLNGLSELFFGNPAWYQAMTRPISLDEVWDAAAGHLTLSSADRAVLSRDFWAGDRLDHDLVALIRGLKQRGVCTALLSNHAAALQDLLAELDVDGLFDVQVISAFEGLVKPEPEIFQRALERLGVAPGDAVFVDDWQAHVDAARGLGIASVRFRGLRPLQRELAGLGLPVVPPPLEAVPGIRAVIFDWGGVLSPLVFFENTAAWEMRLGLVPGVLNQTLWGRAWKQLEAGTLTAEEYDAHVGQNLGLRDRAAVQQFYREYYADEYVDERVLAAVRSLRGRYRVALLTNAFPDHAQMVAQRYGLDVYETFDVYVNSSEVKLAKPDPAIYHLTLEKLGVAPEEAVFVDDMVRNTDSAGRLGLHTLVFTDVETGLADLAATLGHALA